MTETASRIGQRLDPARSKLLSSLPHVIHGVSHRVKGLGTADGNIGLGSPRDKEDAWEMRKLWAQEIGVDPKTIVTAGQVHEATVLRVGPEDAGKGSRAGFPQAGIADGLITDSPDVTLLTLHADCQPILLVDPDRPAVAAVHAGWRGTIMNIAGAAVDAMQQAFDSDPADLLVYLGPALGGCCAEMGQEVIEMWQDTAGKLGIDADCAITTPGERSHFDVPEANRQLLIQGGVLDQNIDVSDECTRCDTTRWFSHRGHGPNAGREGAFIAIRSSQKSTGGFQ